MRFLWRALCLGTFCCIAARAQGTFRNFDFESAKVPILPSGQYGTVVNAEDALPGWNAYATVFHNTVSIGGALLAVYGPEWRSSDILQGNYSVGMFTDQFGQVPVAIGQTGQIPSDAKSVLFYGAGEPGFQPPLRLSFAGTDLPLFDIGTRDKYRIYGADISSFAGNAGELRFALLPNVPGSRGSFAIIDNIEFSTLPEPGTVAILLGGMIILAADVWRRRRRSDFSL